VSRDRIAATLELAGLAAVVAAFFVVFPPLGLIVLGLALLVVGIAIEKDG